MASGYGCLFFPFSYEAIRRAVTADSFRLKDAANDNVLHALDPKVLDILGRALKAHFDDLIREPLPEKIFDLLSHLDETTAEETGGCT